MAKNLKEPSLNIRKKKSKFRLILVSIDRCNTSPAQSGAAGESAAAGGPKCKKLCVKLRTVAVGANCEGLHSSKSHKSNCSPVEVHFFFFENEKSSSVHENL